MIARAIGFHLPGSSPYAAAFVDIPEDARIRFTNRLQMIGHLKEGQADEGKVILKLRIWRHRTH